METGPGTRSLASSTLHANVRPDGDWGTGNVWGRAPGETGTELNVMDIHRSELYEYVCITTWWLLCINYKQTFFMNMCFISCFTSDPSIPSSSYAYPGPPVSTYAFRAGVAVARSF